MQTTRFSWLWQLQLGLLALSALAIAAFRLQLLSWRPSLLLTAAALALVILIGFFSLLLLFAKLRVGTIQGVGRHGLLAAGLSLPVLIGVLLLGLRSAKAPPIHDITTDPSNPPALIEAVSQRGPLENSARYAGAPFANQQLQAYADILPLQSNLPPDLAFDHCLATAHALGWEIIAQDRRHGRIEAIDRSLIFGFIDDIAIRIAPRDAGSRIDLRSASRVGISDLGVNAKRIRAFSDRFTATPSR